MMAYITRYIFGTDKLRPNAFEVRGMNGSNTGVIHINDLAVLSHWIKLIGDYISALTNHKGAVLNRGFKEHEQITYMSWVAEGILNRNQPWQNWKPKFFALRGSEVHIFESPPVSNHHWHFLFSEKLHFLMRFNVKIHAKLQKGIIGMP